MRSVKALSVSANKELQRKHIHGTHTNANYTIPNALECVHFITVRRRKYPRTKGNEIERNIEEGNNMLTV